MRELLFLTFVVFIHLSSQALPPSIIPCSRSSPNLANCIKNVIESLKTRLKNGNIGPDFVIEGIDPLDLGNVTIKQGYEMKLTRFKALGTSNFKIEKVRVNLENVKLDLVVNMPEVTTQANYVLNWKLPLINLQGNGVAYSYLKNLKSVVKIKGSSYLKHGVTYFRIDVVKIEIKLGEARAQFENLFNGQKALETIGNELINQNIDSLSKHLIPAVERGMEAKLLKVSNQVFSKASADEFFPL